MTAAIGVAELLGAATEALSWTGQYGRTMSGAKMREQEEREPRHAQALDVGQPGNKARSVKDGDAGAHHREEVPADTYHEYR
jgi:hypothetical protein